MNFRNAPVEIVRKHLLETVTETRSRKFWDWLGLLVIFLAPFIYYWRATLGLGMFYFGDLARFFFPTRVLYANALHAGRLPLWQPEILTGIPLLAEMQTGALYPPHILLYGALPVELALNYDILAHLAFLGAGMFLFARVKNISTSGALIAAFALMLGGFGTARITHPNVLNVAAWLPWLLYFYEQWRAKFFPSLMWLFLTLGVAMQWLGGHPQFAFINCAVFAVYVVLAGLFHQRGTPRKEPSRSLVLRLYSIGIPFAALLLGTMIASAQLLATLEFAQQSARAGGVDPEFFTTFSFHPLYLALLGAPFLRGNPYPNTSVEVIVYIGILPLVFAGCAVILKREREVWLWVALAFGALFLAFGGNTPLYPALRVLPLFNLFRVPARFLFPFAFALAMLAGFGFDALRVRTYESKMFRNALLVVGATAALAFADLILVNVLPTDAWIDAWQGLPILFGALAVFLVMRAQQLDRLLFTTTALGLTLIDLLAFGSVYAQTFNQIAPRSEIFPRPRVLDQLQLQKYERVLTSEWILPWTLVMNESLYPNLNAAHNVTAAHGYTPLAPRNTREFLDNLSPVMLNKLGVRYYLIPQLLPVDPKTEAADVRDPFLMDPISAPLEFSVADSDSIEIESSLAQSANLPNNAWVADVVLTDEDAKEYRVQLLAGRDTAEWAYDRSDVTKAVQHARPQIASSFPARSAFPIENHVGHTFRTRINFAPAPVPIKTLRVEPKINANLLHIQRVALLNGDAAIDLAPLLGKGRHALVYRSEDVAVFENAAASPRAFVTHNVKREADATAFLQMRSPEPNAEIYIADGPEFETDVGQGLGEQAEIVLYEPERVVVETKLDSEGYLVLTDAWDPGWSVLVDGAPASITRADVIFRAVLLEEGSHRVEFLYRPRAFYIGLILSGIGIALLGIVMLATILLRIPRGKDSGTRTAGAEVHSSVDQSLQ